MPTENEVQYCEVTGFSLSPNSEGYIIHRDTGTRFNPSGFDHSGRDVLGYDVQGFDSSGFDREGWDIRGFDNGNRHRVTRTHYHPEDHLTWDSSRYSEDNDERDWQGNTRCDNAECNDSDCERCYPSDDDEDDDESGTDWSSSSSFDECLLGYDKRAPRVHGWSPKFTGILDVDRTLYAGHEIEMYSDDEDAEDVEFVLRQLDSAYARFNPQTRTRKCAIAKHDGSLDDYGSGGFETVTVPLTREQMYGIFESFKVLGNGRCSAWTRGDSVGHHIHLSRAAIGPLTLGKLLVFLNAYVNRSFLVSVAGRDGDFNSFVPGKKLTDAENGDRYEVLNVTDQTVEFRLFKSNLYSRAILKNYEFAVSAVRFCEDSPHGNGAPESEDDPLSFVKYRRYVAAHHKEYPYLHAFLLTHHRLKRGYTSSSGLRPNAIPKERSPKFALIRTNDPLQTC